MRAANPSKHRDNLDDLEIPLLDAMRLASALEKLIAQTDILDDLSEGERQTVMETLAQRLVRETKAVHEIYRKTRFADRPPLTAVTSPG